MYSASEDFHTAVKNGAHQIALLIFDDAVFTNDDIDVSNGITFNDYFNADEDLNIGQALSNEISFTLFNDQGLLNDYEFGDFLATIGAQIGNDTVTAQGILQAHSGSHSYVAYNTSPYLRRDGISLASQPRAKVKSILIYDGWVYCLLEDGTTKIYEDSNGFVVEYSLNDFMLNQMARWEGKGISYDKNTRILKIWKGTNRRTYEFVPLGYFTAERPNVPTTISIDFTCYDFMQKFEKDMPGKDDLAVSYPLTIKTLFTAMCDYASVDYRNDEFINEDAVIASEPEDFSSVTMREVIQWIAELAGSNARFDRDGYIKMDWVRETEQELDETDYSEFDPYWYETKNVTKLYNRASNGDYEYTVGEGEEGYLIQDNPLLKGVN